MLMRALVPQAAAPGPLHDYWYEPVGSLSSSGLRIDEATAMKIATYWRCVSVLSDAVGMLPLHVYRRVKGGGKQRAWDLPVYRLLHDQPNPWMTSFQFRETLMGHLLLWGNAYSEIRRDDNGAILGLYPLRPDRMARPVEAGDGSMLYPCTLHCG